MAFSALPPQVQFPLYDLRPRVEIVQEAPEPAYAKKLSEMALLVEGEIAPLRRQSEISFREAESSILRAEQEGWYVDVAPMLKALRDAKRFGESALQVTQAKLASAINKAIAGRIRGANVMGTYAGRIKQACRGLLNDLDDWEDTLVSIQKRMEAHGKDTVMSRSADAYAEAIERSFGVQPSHEIQMESSLGGPYIRFDVPVNEDGLSDAERILTVEDAVHAIVASKDQALVGLVALNYVVA